MLSIYRSVAVIFLLVCLSNCSNTTELVTLHGKTMGTTYSIKYLSVEGQTPQQLQIAIDEKLEWVNDLMSTWRDDSELSRFNQLKKTQAYPVSAELIEVVSEAQRLYQLSGGSLDVTAGRIFSLWGFDAQARPEKVPSEAQITVAKQHTGMEKLVISENSLTKLHPELYLNLSSIAKGYGVDVVAELLESRNIQNYMVEVGGEIRLKGLKANGKKWRMAVEKPLSNERSIQRVLELSDTAMATSGDYRIYFEENGVRYSHLIDPVTARPITHNLVSVTVLHASSMTADGLATMFNVLGAEKSLKIAEQHNLATMLIVKEKQGFKELYSSAMKAYL